MSHQRSTAVIDVLLGTRRETWGPAAWRCCHGPESMLASRAARAVCYAPAYTIQGGTSQVLRNVIAERLLGLPR